MALLSVFDWSSPTWLSRGPTASLAAELNGASEHRRWLGSGTWRPQAATTYAGSVSVGSSQPGRVDHRNLIAIRPAGVFDRRGADGERERSGR